MFERLKYDIPFSAKLALYWSDVLFYTGVAFNYLGFEKIGGNLEDRGVDILAKTFQENFKPIFSEEGEDPWDDVYQDGLGVVTPDAEMEAHLIYSREPDDEVNNLE